jgi:hypothetical protein
MRFYDPNPSGSYRTRPLGLNELIIIDGHLAQVLATGGNYFSSITIRFLDDVNDRINRVNLRKYQKDDFVPDSLDHLLETGRVRLSGEQMARIHWGPEALKNPNLKRNIRVVARYVEPRPLRVRSPEELQVGLIE